MAGLSRSVGGYVASEVSIELFGRALPPARRGLLIPPAGQGVGDRQWLTASAAIRALNALLAEYWPVFAADCAQTNSSGQWGSSTMRTRIGQLKTWAQDATKVPVPAASGQVLGWLGSGGFLNGCAYEVANPGSFKALAGLVPLTHAKAFHDANVGGFAVDMETAWGGLSAFNSGMATYDPISAVATLKNVPQKLWYVSDDALIDPDWVEAYAAAIEAAGGDCELAPMTPTGAGHSTLPDVQEIIDFLQEHE